MGAGGGMWASAREELRRPGLRGGGGGKPLLANKGFAGTTGLGAVSGVAASCTFLPTGTAANLTTGLVTDLATALAIGFGATLTVGLLTTFAGALDVGFEAALGVGFATAFTGVLPSAVGDLTTGLEAIFFATCLDLLANLATTLSEDLDLAAATFFSTVLLALTLPAFFTAGAGLLALLFALADFSGFAAFAFTVCLLWDAASG